jgi:hypothetical protein
MLETEINIRKIDSYPFTFLLKEKNGSDELTAEINKRVESLIVKGRAPNGFIKTDEPYIDEDTDESVTLVINIFTDMPIAEYRERNRYKNGLIYKLITNGVWPEEDKDNKAILTKSTLFEYGYYGEKQEVINTSYADGNKILQISMNHESNISFPTDNLTGLSESDRLKVKTALRSFELPVPHKESIIFQAHP